MIHGKRRSSSCKFFKKILKLFPNAKKKLIIIPNGDHSLSRVKYLKRINRELNTIISYVI